MSFNSNYIVSYLYITMVCQKAGRRKKDKVGKEQYEVEVVYKRYNAPDLALSRIAGKGQNSTLASDYSGTKSS